MSLDPIKEASPLEINNIQRLLADYDKNLSKKHDHPKDVSIMSTKISNNFIISFCRLFGKKVEITNEDRGYLKLNLQAKTFDTRLSQWLNQTKAKFPNESEEIQAHSKSCRLHSGDVLQLMLTTKNYIEKNYE